MVPETGFVEDNFSIDWVGGWGQDYSSALHLLCIWFMLLLHQFHFRSSGIRSQSLGTPASKSYKLEEVWSYLSCKNISFAENMLESAWARDREGRSELKKMECNGL